MLKRLEDADKVFSCLGDVLKESRESIDHQEKNTCKAEIALLLRRGSKRGEDRGNISS